MRRSFAVSLVLLLTTAAACATGEVGPLGGFGGGSGEGDGTTVGGGGQTTKGNTGNGAGPSTNGDGQGGSITGPASTTTATSTTTSTSASTSTTTSTSTSSTSGGGGGTPTTCAEANGAVGCCKGTSSYYYCAAGSTSVSHTSCTSGKVCGWNDSKGYYACVAAPGGADPSNENPMECP